MDKEITPEQKRKMRTGFTTGSCAAASAKAALIALLTGSRQDSVEITLPAHQKAVFKLHHCEISGQGASASIIKDAGDDPDCTHGAEIGARVRLLDKPGVVIEGGEGVGVITKPGLGLPLNGPAINPTPRKMITASCEEVLKSQRSDQGVLVTVYVPQGAEIVKRTLNHRLGILGGISILGTTGIVRPYSTASFKASVIQAIDVAKANHAPAVVLTTGGRSEQYAEKILGLPAESYVQMGDFVGDALRRCAKHDLPAVVCAMIGKMSKLAAGMLWTHARAGDVDFQFLSRVAEKAGASPETAEEIKKANTARHVQEIVTAAGIQDFFGQVCEQACQVARREVKDRIRVECILVDFDGAVLGRRSLG